MVQQEHFEAAVALIDAGDVDGLRQILADHPELATSRAADGATLLIRLIDSPGHRPNSAESTRVLLAAGADIESRRNEKNGTALAGSLCMVELDVIRVLIEAGADIHAPCGWRSGTILDLADQMFEDASRNGEREIRELIQLFSSAAGRPVPGRPSIGGTVPLLFVKDVDAGIEFYRAKMGFWIDWIHESGCDSKYVGMSRGGTEFHMTTCECEDGGHTGKLDTRISTDNVDQLFEEFRTAGVTIRSEPIDQPWGFREMETEDPDGNRFTFYGHHSKSDGE